MTQTNRSQTPLQEARIRLMSAAGFLDWSLEQLIPALYQLDWCFGSPAGQQPGSLDKQVLACFARTCVARKLDGLPGQAVDGYTAAADEAKKRATMKTRGNGSPTKKAPHKGAPAKMAVPTA